jgi:hypothetical protein
VQRQHEAAHRHPGQEEGGQEVLGVALPIHNLMNALAGTRSVAALLQKDGVH